MIYSNRGSGVSKNSVGMIRSSGMVVRVGEEDEVAFIAAIAEVDPWDTLEEVMEIGTRMQLPWEEEVIRTHTILGVERIPPGKTPQTRETKRTLGIIRYKENN